LTETTLSESIGAVANFPLKMRAAQSKREMPGPAAGASNENDDFAFEFAYHLFLRRYDDE
jgi:hypothetical protein